MRAVIDPEKDMGHIDRALKKGKAEGTAVSETGPAEKGAELIPERPAEVGASTGVVGTELAGTVRSEQAHSHAGHAVSLSTVGDCAECMAAAKEEELQSERGNPLG